MALEMKETSKWWYGRIKVNGKLRRFPLMETRNGRQQRIEIKGRRPKTPSRWEEGDAAFIESYHRAKAAHEALLSQVLTPVRIVEHEQRIIEAKRGARVDFVKIQEVPGKWEAISRKRDPSPKYVRNGKQKLQRFVDFMSRNHPEVEELIAVSSAHVQAFLTEEADRGISPTTWNSTLKRLKTVFSRFAPEADGYRDCLKRMEQRDEDTVHREPFTEEEIQAILEAARDDDLLRPLIVTALCTAMRRADCALLRWESIDLASGFIEVRTSKTGESAEIPILPLLLDELTRVRRKKAGYVFPEAAERFSTESWKLNRRFQQILAAAGFVDEPREDADGKAVTGPAPRWTLPKLAPAELRRRALATIAGSDFAGPRKEKMKAVFSAYSRGASMADIAADLGVSSSTVSRDLLQIEEMVGAAVVRRPVPAEAPKVIRGTIRAEKNGAQRKHRGSLRGWHSFRTTFVTRALAGGMPEELVRKVTGHTAVDVVRKHYFKPGREDFRQAFEKAMPGLTMNGAKSRDERLREIIQRMGPEELREEALGLLGKG